MVRSVQTPAEVQLTNSISIPGQGQMYYFEAQATTALTVDMVANDESLDPLLKLYQLHNGWPRARRSNNNAYRGTVDSRITYNLQCGEVYYIQAIGNGKTIGQYDLHIQTELIDEAGDSFAEALPVALNRGGGKNYKAIIDHAADVDFFQVVATKTGILSIEQRPFRRRDTFNCGLYAYDAEQNPLIVDEDAGADGINEVRFEVEAGQTYYVKVAHFEGQHGKYRLRFRTRPADEAGNTFDGALVLQLNRRGHKTFNGAIDPKGDIDYFQIVATKDGILSVQQKRRGPKHPAGYHLFAYDSDRQLIISDENGYDDGINEVRFEVVAGQTYYIKALQPDEQVGKYQLKLRTNRPDEGGDSFEEALIVELNRYGAKSTASTIDLVGDVDYFKFAATRTGLVTVNQYAAIGPRDGGNFTLTAYDTERNLLSELADTDADGVNTTSFSVVNDKLYYVKVARDDRKAGKQKLDFKIKPNKVNTAPTLSALPDKTLSEDGGIDNAIDLWAYASDTETADSDLIFSIAGVTNSNAGVSIDAGRYIDISPAANWTGTSDVTIRLSDGSLTATDTFRVTVNSVNDAPVLAPLPDKSLSEDGGINNAIDLWAYASDTETADSDLIFSIAGVTNSNAGVSIDAGRYIDISPVANWSGTSDVTIRLSDGSLTATDTFRVTVNGVNDAPVLAPLSDKSLNEDGGIDNAIDLWAYASDTETADSSLIFSIAGVTNSNAGVSIDAGRYIDINPVANWSGTSDVTIRLSDGSLTATDTFRVTVNGVNDAPTLSTVNTLNGTMEDTAFEISYDDLAAAANEYDADGNTLSFLVANVSSGTLTKLGVPVTPGVTMLSSGESWVWAPAANAHGTLDAFTIKAWDGTAASPAAAQVQVVVTPVNDAPVAGDDSLQAVEDQSASTSDVLANDTDADGDGLTVAEYTQPGHGTVAYNDDGTFTYQPTAGFYGADSFTYTVTDGNGGTDQATVNITVQQAAARDTFYVATWGSDLAAGTFDAPFASVETAQSAIRDLRAETGLPEGGVTVYLRGGTYYRSSTFALTSQDSGEADKPIVYKAYGNEDVRLVGGVAMDDDWFSVVTSTSSIWDRLAPEAQGTLLVADLNGRGIDMGQLSKLAPWHWGGVAPTELFFNGEAQTLGRTEGWMTVTATPDGRYAGTFTCDALPNTWTQAEDIWFSGLFGAYWYNTVVGGTVDSTTVTLDAAPPSMGIKPDMPFYAFNLLEEIDTPGEYYINRDTGKLYFWAPEELSGSSQIYLSQMDSELLELQNTQYLTFEGITFEAVRGGLVTISGGSDNALVNCVLRNTGSFGAEISGTNNGLEYSQVYNVGGRGVRLTGGDRPSLTAGGNYVRNTDLHNWGRWIGTSKVGIHIEGVGQIVSHNLMHDAPSGAIWYYGNDHLIEYNDIYGVCAETADAGAIYAGRDWSFQGIVIQYNFIHDLSSPFTTWQLFGVYLDDAVSGATVHGNLFYQIDGFATFNGGGRDNIFTNNVIAHCYGGHRTDRRGVDIITDISGDDCNFLEKLNAAAGGDYTTGVWAETYPHLLEIPNDFDLLGDLKNPGGTVFSRNIGYGLAAESKWLSEGIWGGAGALDWYAEVTDNIYGLDPLFVDEAGGDLNLRADSPAFSIAGFEAIPFDEIGIELVVN